MDTVAIIQSVVGGVLTMAVLGAVKGIFGIRAEMVEIRAEMKAIRAEMGLRFSEGERRFEALEERMSKASDTIARLRERLPSNGGMKSHGR